MKKIAIVILLSSTLLLAACSNNNAGNTVASSSKVESKASKDKSTKNDVSFKDGVLETEDYKLKIKSTETIQSPSVDKPGLYVTFELTNKSDDTLTPFKVLYDIGFKQKTETSLVKMSAGYHSFDAFGDDTDSMNRITERQNALSNELLPEKTVEIYEAYSLDNVNDEVQVLPDIDDINPKNFEAYVIKPTALSTGTSGSQSENGLALDDNGHIITQAQKDQLEAQRQPIYGDHSASIRDARYQEAIANGATEQEANDYANGKTTTYTPQQQPSAQQDLDTLSLTDFVNKYGMSPAAYKIQVQGMSEEEALRSTQQLTSGERQLAFSKYGIND